MNNLLQINFFSDTNLGLYGKACDKFCIIGKDFLEKYKDFVEKELKVEVYGLKIYNSNFIGLFSCFNSNGIILSKVCYKEEIEEIKKSFDLNILVFENTKFTAIGNLISCNDKGAIVSKKFGKKQVKEIEDVLGVEVVKTNIAKSYLVGSCCLSTNKGALIHRDAKEEEIELVKSVLKIRNVDVGTLNLGSPFVGALGIANSFGFIASEKTTPIEINRAIEALGLL